MVSLDLGRILAAGKSTDLAHGKRIMTVDKYSKRQEGSQRCASHYPTVHSLNITDDVELWVNAIGSNK